MFQFDIKPSPRLVRQIAKLERLAGRWDYLSKSPALASAELLREVIREEAEASYLLDSTAPVGRFLDLPAEELAKAYPDSASLVSLNTRSLEALIEAYEQEPKFNLEYLEELYLALSAGELKPEQLSPNSVFRTNVQTLNIPVGEDLGDVAVFQTLSSFLIENRLNELLGWVSLQLKERHFHPLIVIGTFHLLFLHASPFKSANHRISLLLCWNLLEKSNYPFVRYAGFARMIPGREQVYAAALRQAEKTTYDSWSSLNIWLEFFLKILLAATEDLLERCKLTTKRQRLTQTQRKIVQAIREHGALSREKIVDETGINVATVKYNLGVLADSGHLEREGGGRSTSYRVV